ncbi:OLC1v1025366C1 [Oldenlandia corymbosa var. corymbosa]|uniref:OLC1v1025366C1 n=1 Tax=Oldenlandia corymbosa var. corymbosa TaxID=529605 RepID=A0AAV1C7E6_OLDCO|nr:OLC1v1025366C1 [Oldenlandia corymbosa var. corymbosa]
MASNNNFQWDAPNELDPFPVPEWWDTVPYTPNTPELPLFDDPMIFGDGGIPESDHSGLGFPNTGGVESLVLQEEQGNESGRSLEENVAAPQVLEPAAGDVTLRPNVENDVQITTEAVPLHMYPLVVIHEDDKVAGIQGDGEASSSSTQKARRRRGPITATVIEVSSVYFEFIRNAHDHHSNTHTLAMYNVGSGPEVKVPGTKDETRLVRPDLLKEWRVETRERPDKSQDKFFTHPASRRQFRSVVEVVKFIKTENNLLGPEAFPSLCNGKKRRYCKKNGHLQHNLKKLKRTPKNDFKFEEFMANAHLIVLEPSPTPTADAGGGMMNTGDDERSPEFWAEMIDELRNQ